LIQVNVGIGSSDEMAASEDAQDVFFGVPIREGQSLKCDGSGRHESR
jgi:hypothetical protein